PVLLCWAVMIPAMPTPLRRGLHILLTPWNTKLPPELVAVTVTPGDATLAEGESLEITANIAPRIRNKPLVNAASLEMKAGNGLVDKIDMARSGPRAFKNAMASLTVGFTYRIVSEDGSSPWHTITVMPRPTVESVGVQYTYP